ncbi:MAG: NAD(P)/FAD-dependent oxidoreductase [Chloroflexi bacterium OHK40]
MHTPLWRAFVRALTAARRANYAVAGRSVPRFLPAFDPSRRQLLRATLAGPAALAATGLSRPVAAQHAQSRGSQPRIAIVGGGLAGLTAAYHLQQAGLSANLYEARARLGGRVRTLRAGVAPGLAVEFGGEFINSDHDDMLALAAELGLTLFDRAADAARFPLPATSYLFDGRSIPEAEMAEALRPLARQIADDAALLDEDYERYAPAFDRTSVARYLDQHAGLIAQPFVRALIERSIRTELGVEADETSALHLIFLLPTVDGAAVEVLGNSDEQFTVEGGSSRIVEGLVARLKGSVHLRHVLTAVAQRGAGYRLAFANGTSVDAEYVILAMPFAVLRRVTLDLRLPGRLRRMIAELDSGRNEKLLAGFRRRAWRQDAGFSSEAWSDIGFAAAWDATQREVDREAGALTFFLGGEEAAALDGRNTRQLGQQFVDALGAALPGLREAATGTFARSRWGADRFSNGSYVTFRPGQYTRFSDFLYIEADEPMEYQEVRVGNLAFAGEHLSDAYYGYMNGAAQTGRLAAASIAALVADARGLRATS